ncbi:hypothetical protein [Gaoshiqia sediminis]|uniref:DUF481 domain-containing protein n=1 Tax=Gaoshiqia sediminis TaxID=2986998 RepID=A0AA42C889_9BACT|nr:hypothetical protein [Gaoshiqia sediminis]MCW0484429.1 hypothetical protein [Gaoshiqia sediminis]
MKKSGIVLFLLTALFLCQSAQSQPAPGLNRAVRVFIDAPGIDITFLREEFRYVNYARTRDAANVHLLGTVSQTGSGGSDYTFYFIGLHEFSGKSDTLHYFSSGTQTDTEVREGYTKAIKMGLVRYLAHAEQWVDLQFNGKAAVKALPEKDKWDSWVFDIDLTSRISGEEAERQTDFDISVESTRITPEWRYEFDFDNQYDEDWYDTGEDEVIATRNFRQFESLVVKSIGEHMAVGMQSGISRSSYDNIKLNYWFFPAIEYNLFPYELSSRRQLRFSYFLGYNGRQYEDTTIFNKIDEDLFRGKFAIAYRVKEEWGSAYTTISFQNYFHDFNKNSLSVWSGVYVRVWRGLSLNLSGNYSLINDRLSLEKGEASLEEILLQQRQMATAYRYQINMGLSFTFGSLFNNVVNPRLKG